MTSKLLLNSIIISVSLAAAALMLSVMVDVGLGRDVDVQLNFIDTIKTSVVSAKGVFSFLELFIPVFLSSLLTARIVLRMGRRALDKTDRDTSWIKRV
jgi:hypothetical protein